MEWMLENWVEIWNLFTVQRIAVAQKYRPIYEKKAKNNMSLGGRNDSPREGSQKRLTKQQI